MKIVKPLEKSRFLMKEINETYKYEAKTKKAGFFQCYWEH